MVDNCIETENKVKFPNILAIFKHLKSFYKLKINYPYKIQCRRDKRG